VRCIESFAVNVTYIQGHIKLGTDFGTRGLGDDKKLVELLQPASLKAFRNIRLTETAARCIWSLSP